MSSHSIIVNINNNYKTSPKHHLQGVVQDATKIEMLAQKLSIKEHYLLKNLTKDKLLNQLNTIKMAKELGIITTNTVVIFYSGHGAYGNKYKIAGMYTNDLQYVSISQIIEYFAQFENVICIFDACLTIDNKPCYSKGSITNGKAVILYASAIGETALDNKSTGGYLTTSVVDELGSDKFIGLLDAGSDFIKAFAKRMCMIAKMYEININRRRVCKFNANANFRNTFGVYCDMMKGITKQEQINGITMANNAVRHHNTLEELQSQLAALKVVNAKKNVKRFNLFVV